MHGKGMCNKWCDVNPRTKNNIVLTQTHVNPHEKVLDIFKTNDNTHIIGMFPSDGFVWFNFWWASGKYLITCEYTKISRDDRCYYETWLRSGNIPNNKIYNLLENNYKSYNCDEVMYWLHSLHC
jgi:hypothetical protein